MKRYPVCCQPFREKADTPKAITQVIDFLPPAIVAIAAIVVIYTFFNFVYLPGTQSIESMKNYQESQLKLIEFCLSNTTTMEVCAAYGSAFKTEYRHQYSSFPVWLYYPVLFRGYSE